MEWTGCGETPQTDEEELEGKIAAIDLRESMEKSKEFWGDTQFDDKFVITANLLKCPPCCDDHNIVAASQLAHIAWESMTQSDLEEITKINRDLLLCGEIPTNYLIPKIDQILKNTMDINCVKNELQKVDSDYQQAIILVANQLLVIFDENIPPRIVEDDLEVNPSKKSAPPQTPFERPNGNNAKNTPVHKDIKTRIKELMELALQNGLGEIKVPKAAYVNDRAKLAILEKQIKGRLRLKHIIESGASKTCNKSASEDLNKSLHHQGKGPKMLNLSKRLKSAKAMREKILSKVANNISVDDQRFDNKEKLPKERLIKSPHFTSNSQNNVISQISASSSKSDAVYNASSINTGKMCEEEIMANSKYSQPKLLETEKNEEEQVFYSFNVNEPAKNLTQNYLQENNECDGKILFENEAELENVCAREPIANSTAQSSQETRTCPELNSENDTTKNNSNSLVDKTDLTLKDIIKEKSYKSLEEHSLENFYLKNIQKHDLTLKTMTDAKDGGLSLKQKLLDLSPKTIIESASDSSAIRDTQIYPTSQERSIRIKSELTLKNVLENSREDLLIKGRQGIVADSFEKENTTCSFLNNLQSPHVDIQNSQDENIKANKVESPSIHSDSVNKIQISEFPVYNTITNNTNNINKEDFSMRDAIKTATNPDDIINLPIIKPNKNLSIILRETMTQVHAKTNFILTAPPPTPFPKSCSQSFNRSDEFLISSANISSVGSTDGTGETILENKTDDATLKNMNTECGYGETDDYEWLENINAEKIGELNDETVAEEERGGDADDENDFEFDFDVDDLIERNRFLEVEEIKRFKNQASTIETMNDLQLELEMINNEEKNINFCQNDGNEQMHAQVLINDLKNSVVNDKVECKYEQSPIVMTAVNELVKKETEKNDSLTKSPEDLDEKSSNDKLEVENVIEEANKNYEEVGRDEESIEGEDKEEEDEESDEEEDDEDEDDEESESTIEDISSKSASELAKSESGEIQTDSREESDQSLVKEEIMKTEETNAKG
uniref:Uncharacterized protein n=2 Tax=Rhodnius prolixus TaxID=13249 RepID=T1HIY3_RHOPR